MLVPNAEWTALDANDLSNKHTIVSKSKTKDHPSVAAGSRNYSTPDFQLASQEAESGGMYLLVVRNTDMRKSWTGRKSWHSCRQKILPFPSSDQVGLRSQTRNLIRNDWSSFKSDSGTRKHRPMSLAMCSPKWAREAGHRCLRTISELLCDISIHEIAFVFRAVFVKDFFRILTPVWYQN